MTSSLDPTNSIQPALSALQAVTYRQQLNTSNIANAHTPGYMAKSVEFSDLLSDNNPFETGLSRQMGHSVMGPETQTGGAVNMQDELAKMQVNVTCYTMATRRLTTVFNNLKAAAQVGR